VEKKPPSWVWLDQVSTFVRKIGWLVSSLSQTRGGFHLGVLVLIALALSFPSFVPSSWGAVDVTPLAATNTPSPHVAGSSPSTDRQVDHPHSVSEGKAVLRESQPLVQTLFQSPLPDPLAPARSRSDVMTYTVQSGDSVANVAGRFGLQRETLIWSNEELEADPGMLYIGQVLFILPVDGVYHTVQAGETLDEISAMYKVSVEAIVGCAYNERALAGGRELQPGVKLVVPAGVKLFAQSVVPVATVPAEPNAPRGAGNFVWPVGGYISQGYWNLHRAIDIAGNQGDIVVAADAGTVVYAKWESSGYGNLVIVDHGNGYVTYYAHLYGFYVDVGDVVEQGQPLGVCGTTGRSTGPHLHFEIRKDGVPQPPLALLPKHR
jgi:murein DD-endopeptidase MepM/ murein hydrolase activator NlpD